ncbi:NAD-dependent protein deacylase [Nannocystis sp. ILAH1]|uniref:NAD-dependent protein deacylase n=1 Tax=unclassified Nannocystis TaxID=2627009 RepID=UPI00226EDCED|nr:MULTISPECIES: NAD-dependent protein deacylase [unclassified Nannocystis]MCY0985719.1 NAD-dependent protein deacylase [Nannocystis sp. ILAH1]MCY1068403.1 NAD-dependent protein deacylase [Nannocystis sp. RBIL2]
MPQDDLPAATVDAVAALLQTAKRILFITGAGMSADSGLPTYRGIGGLYERKDTDEGFPIEVALSGRMLQSRPEVCWKYIAQIGAACIGARHNLGHEILAAIEREIPGTWVLTQNVDGFHRDAGSRQVIEIHGNARSIVCTRCSRRDSVSDYHALSLPPMCPACGHVLRPEVVLFGELLPPDATEAYERETRLGFDLVVSIGTTSVFPYIAAPVIEAHEQGIPTVEINPGDSEVSRFVDHRLRSRAAVALQALWQRFAAARA